MTSMHCWLCRGCAVVEGARLLRVDDMTFVEEVVVAELSRQRDGQRNGQNTVNNESFQSAKTRTLLRKKLPEMLISSQRTTTIF